MGSLRCLCDRVHPLFFCFLRWSGLIKENYVITFSQSLLLNEHPTRMFKIKSDEYHTRHFMIYITHLEDKDGQF